MNMLPPFGGGSAYPGGPMAAGGSLPPFSIAPAQPAPQGMFGQQGPFGGAVGMNPIMRLLAVLRHAQGLSMPAQHNQAFAPIPLNSPPGGY